MMMSETKEDPLERIRDLQARLDEAEETLRALRSGEVDALVASGPDGDSVYTLRGADQAYRIMVENMAEGALTVMPDGLILYSNEQFASMLAIPLERVIGSSIHDLIAAEDAPMLSALLTHSSGAKAEVCLKKTPHTFMSAQISANTLVVDGAECVCLVITDLSEQKRNQEIMAAERLARSILDQAAGPILVIDPNGCVIRASRAAQEMAARTVLLQKFDDVFRLGADSGAKDYTLEEILSNIRESGRLSGVKVIARTGDGQKHDLILSASRLAGANSEYLGCIILLSDISDLRRAALERARFTRQLEEKNRELERSNEDLAQFAYAVSHDLQEPLRTMTIYTQLLERRLDTSETRPTKLLDGLTGAAAHMRAMIEDVLTLSRVSQSCQSSFSKVNLNEAVERARQNLAAAIAESGAVLDCGPLGEVMGDLSQFALVFQNLIGNAIKYRAGNSPRIIISSTQDASLHRVSVRDNGLGIDSKYHTRIFGLFKRLHGATEIAGTGIGLAITQRIIERHGGRIWVESELGQGATFVFTLPVLGTTDIRPGETAEEFHPLECDVSV